MIASAMKWNERQKVEYHELTKKLLGNAFEKM